MQKERFYIDKHIPAQRGLYRLLILKKGIDPEIVVECLEEFYKTYMEPHFSNTEKKTYKFRGFKYKRTNTIETACYQWIFPKFLDIVTSKTGIIFKQGPTKTSSYDKWYEEASMDGSLAYNGVTDDF